MWSDTLLSAERAHLERLLAWGALGAAVGLALLVLARLPRGRSPLLLHFGLQMLVWGTAEALGAFAARSGLGLRDYAAATRLDRLLWLETGLDVGIVAAGAVLAVAAWMLARRLGAVGAGIAIALQGLALAVLHLSLLAVTSQFV